MAKNSYSLLFDGATRRATIPASSGTAGPSLKGMTAFTVMAWIKPDPGLTQYQRLWVERQGTGTGIRFAITPFDGKLRFEFSPKDGVADTNYDYKYTWDDRWHHVAFVARLQDGGSTYETYLDASLVAEGSLVIPSNVDTEGGGGTQPIVTNTWPQGSKVYLGNASFHTSGSEEFSASRYWDGNVDEILIFNEAKTQGDIVTYFTSDDIWDMTDTGMFSYWRLDTGTGTTTTDADNPGWTMTLTSSSMWDTDRPFLGDGVVDNVAPTAPTSAALVGGSTTPDGFTVQWNASTDQAPATHNAVYVQFYELQVSTTSDFLNVVGTFNTGRNTSWHVDGLTPSTNYYARVSALDAESNRSSWSSTVSVTTSSEGDVTPPDAPTNLSAPSANLSFSSFRVTWTASVASDVDGYKLDVARDRNFTDYLQDFRNRDVGDLLQFDVYGATPLKTFYVRVRSYDDNGLESANSATLEVQTIAVPDLTPPLAVEMLPPTSVTSRAATLNWEEGIDDVGIATYYVDISTAENFSSYITAQDTVWNNVNIGNILSYHITGLEANTTYYYRVRAQDGAGNIGPNPSEPIPFTTEPSSLDEGGLVTSFFSPTGDTWVNSGATGTNFGADTTLNVLGSGAATTREAFLHFDLSYVAGAIEHAMLRLFVTEASAASMSITVDNISINENTLTWANQPAIGGGVITFTPLTVGEWVEIDIASLMLDGPTNYTVNIFTNSTDGFSFSSKEGTDSPQLVVESNPSTITEVEPELFFYDYDGLVTNYIKNPSFETNATSWSNVGTTPATSARITSDAYSGTACLEVTCSGAASGQGVRYATNDIPAVSGQWWAAAAYVKSVSGSVNLTIRITEYSSGGSALISSSTAYTLITGEWLRMEMSRQLNNASTAFVTVEFVTTGGTAAVFRLDSVIMQMNTDHQIAAVGVFDGDTDGGSWVGTVHASRSVLQAARVKMVSNYASDANQNNSVVPYYRRRRETEWIHFGSLLSRTTNDRSNKRVTSWFGPTHGVYNYVKNPSFEIDLAHWTIVNPNTNATITRDTDVFTQANEYDAGVASCRIAYGPGAGSGIRSNIAAIGAANVVNARAKFFAAIGTTVRLAIRALNSSGTFLSESSSLLGSNQLSGNGDWQELIDTFTTPTNTARVQVEVRVVTTTASTIWVDTVLLNNAGSALNNPYRDGQMPDAMWDGNPHNSYTSLRVLPDVDFSFKHRYSDVDGVLNALEDGFYHLSDSYVTAQNLDVATTITDMVLTPTTDTINVEVFFDGDDNENMTASIRYKRADLTTYESVPVIYDHEHTSVRAVIAGLKSGVRYTVRASLKDADGAFGPSISADGLTATISDSATTLTTYDASDTESLIMFGGFVLMGRQDGHIGVSSHDAFGLPDRRVQVEDLPRVDGAIELQNLWGRRRIRMTGFIGGDSRANLEDNKNMLKRALAPKLQRLVIDTLSNEQRYYIASCESLAISEVGGENITHLTWDAEFICADPFAYDAELTILPEFLANSGNSVAIFNEGDIESDPIIKIRTTNSRAVTVTVMNTTTGERITPDTSILSNDVLVIDTAKFSITKNGVEVDYAGGFIHLAAGSNQIMFILTSVLSNPSIRCEINWRSRYL